MNLSETIRIWDSGQKKHILVRVDIEIDTRELLSLAGQKAWRNRSRKSRFMSGIIKAEVRPSIHNEPTR